METMEEMNERQQMEVYFKTNHKNVKTQEMIEYIERYLPQEKKYLRKHP